MTKEKIIFCIFILICSLIVFKFLSVQISKEIEFKKYPDFNKSTLHYHKTRDIIKDTIYGDVLNPFYSSFDLTPDIEDDSLKIFSYAPLDHPKDVAVKIMIVCGQHGREYITSELCYTLIRLLQRNIRDMNFTTQLLDFQKQNVGFWIIPVANPWARIFVESNISTNSCRRTNANGVDLNRNFPYPKMPDWETKRTSPYSDNGGFTTEDFAGKTPLSEYETIAVAEYMEYVKPHLIINIHSGSNDILLPFDHDVDSRPDYYRIMVQLANYARYKTCPECKVGNSALVLYPAYGTLIDYALTYADVQLGFTLEIYASSKINNDHELNLIECQEYFNPPVGLELSLTLRKWITFLLLMVEKLLLLIKN